MQDAEDVLGLGLGILSVVGLELVDRRLARGRVRARVRARVRVRGLGLGLGLELG